jgi:hypothetical protein
MKEVQRNIEGYFVFPLVFKYDSPRSRESIKTQSPLRGMTNWRVVDEAAFNSESTDFHRVHGTYDPKAGFVEWSHAFGKFNQTVKPDETKPST